MGDHDAGVVGITTAIDEGVDELADHHDGGVTGVVVDVLQTHLDVGVAGLLEEFDVVAESAQGGRNQPEVDGRHLRGVDGVALTILLGEDRPWCAVEILGVGDHLRARLALIGGRLQ